MCLASRVAKKATDATQGATYGIGTIGLDDGTANRVGALHALGTKAEDRVYCVKTDQKLTVSKIPQDLQNKFGLADTAVATFFESKRYHADDVLDFGGGKRVQLRAFANKGVQVFVGERASKITRAVDSILAGAAAAASAPHAIPSRELENA